MRLSVVIPFYNEEQNAAPLVREVDAALAGRVDYEIVAVDDGSSDGTVAALRGMAGTAGRLQILRHDRNLGQSVALVNGIRAARAPWVATLDGDGQNDPADLPRLLEHVPAEGHAGSPLLIAGNRRRRHDNWLRRVSSRTANRVRQALLHDDCPDTGCGLKVFPRDAFMALPHFNHLHRFLPALFRRAGGRVVNVPVNHRPRAGGRSKYGVWNRLGVGIVDLLGVRWLQSRPCPIREMDDVE